MGHISLAGIASSTAGPALSYSSKSSFYLMKIDSSLTDNNCFVERSAITTTDLKPRIQLSTDPLMFQITGKTLYPHSNIASTDKTSTL